MPQFQENTRTDRWTFGRMYLRMEGRTNFYDPCGCLRGSNKQTMGEWKHVYSQILDTAAHRKIRLPLVLTRLSGKET